MDRVRAGETYAFEVIFDRHSTAAFSLAYRMCGRRAMAEEVAQEAFLSLWRSVERYDRARGSVRAWVLSAVHNRAVDAFRREVVKDSPNVHDEELVERLESRERTERKVEQRDDAYRVRSSLESLPAEQRQVIELAYFGGFTHTEIAGMLELPSATVKGRMRLGLTRFRLALAGATDVVT